MPPVNPRIQARVPDRIAQRLADRAHRMNQGGSESQQAITELAMWFDVLDIERRRLRLTLAQASCIADVCNTWLLDATLARPGLVYAECYDAFRLAREGQPVPDYSSYGRKWGPEGCDSAKWEQDLLDYLGSIGPVADHALRDAISRWWEESREATAEGFDAVGLRVLDDDPDGENQ